MGYDVDAPVASRRSVPDRERHPRCSRWPDECVKRMDYSQNCTYLVNFAAAGVVAAVVVVRTLVVIAVGVIRRSWSRLRPVSAGSGSGVTDYTSSVTDVRVRSAEAVGVVGH